MILHGSPQLVLSPRVLIVLYQLIHVGLLVNLKFFASIHAPPNPFPGFLLPVTAVLDLSSVSKSLISMHCLLSLPGALNWSHLLNITSAY